MTGAAWPISTVHLFLMRTGEAVGATLSLDAIMLLFQHSRIRGGVWRTVQRNAKYRNTKYRATKYNTAGETETVEWCLESSSRSIAKKGCFNCPAGPQSKCSETYPEYKCS